MPVTNKKAFTLIELLVVVLIMGILAAIALPQYYYVVEKSRAVEYLTLGYKIVDAQRRFYMTNGHYADSLDDLDIQYAGHRSAVNSGGQKTFVFDNKNIQILPLNVQNEVEIRTHVTSNSGKMAFRFHIGLQETYNHYKAGIVSCLPVDQGSGTLGRRICDDMCGGSEYTYTPQKRCIIGNY